MSNNPSNKPIDPEIERKLSLGLKVNLLSTNTRELKLLIETAPSDDGSSLQDHLSNTLVDPDTAQFVGSTSVGALTLYAPGIPEKVSAIAAHEDVTRMSESQRITSLPVTPPQKISAEEIARLLPNGVNRPV